MEIDIALQKALVRRILPWNGVIRPAFPLVRWIPSPQPASTSRNISKFMRFYLISFACTASSLLATSRATELPVYVPAIHFRHPFNPLTTKLAFPWSLFILSPRPFQFFYSLAEGKVVPRPNGSPGPRARARAR